MGKDVAVALGYAEPRSAVSKRVEVEDRGVAEMETPSGPQQMTIINESGLYSLIFGSKLEKAKRFKHWVTSEVLPALRKTGSYTISQGQNGQSKPMSREYLLATAFMESQKIISVIRPVIRFFLLNDRILVSSISAA